MFMFFLCSVGHKLAAVVCDDESNETVASTVVNCAKIDQGNYHRNHRRFDIDLHIPWSLMSARIQSSAEIGFIFFHTASTWFFFRGYLP